MQLISNTIQAYIHITMFENCSAQKESNFNSNFTQ